jgi:hypothetical protein
VFEIGVRLTYAADPHTLMAALMELKDAILADLPPQVLLQKPASLEAVIGLARAIEGGGGGGGVSGSADDDVIEQGAVRAAALGVLRAVARSLKVRLYKFANPVDA